MTKVYRVHEGVEWVNGARVPADRKVHLTDAEARFDLDQGRIEPDALADLENEAAEDAAAERREISIKQGARRGKHDFKLSGGDADGRD